MTTEAQITENLFRNWKDIDKRVKYLMARKMSESVDGEVDYKASYFKCLEERDVARRDYEVMYKLCQGAEADVEKLKKRIQFIEPIHWVESNFEREKLAAKYMEQYGYTDDTPNRDAILSAFCAGYTASQASGSELSGLVMREGYCCDCKNNPVESVVDAAKIPGHPCNGCWFHDDKSNWEARDE